MAPNHVPGQRHQHPAELPRRTGRSDARFAQNETGEAPLVTSFVEMYRNCTFEPRFGGLTAHLPPGVQVGLGGFRDDLCREANTSANLNDAEQLADIVATGMRFRDAVPSAELTNNGDRSEASAAG